MATKANSKPCQTCETKLFPQSLLASEANSEHCEISKMEFLAKIVKNQKLFTIFATTSILVFGKVLNMLSNEFEYQR